MKRHLLLLAILASPGWGFDPVKDVRVVVHKGAVTLTIPSGAHLKAKAFKVVLGSEGVLRLGPYPPVGDTDEAGDPIWRGTVKVGLSGERLQDPSRLEITYQPCTEGPDGVCYLPVKHILSVPAAELEVK